MLRYLSPTSRRSRTGPNAVSTAMRGAKMKPLPPRKLVALPVGKRSSGTKATSTGSFQLAGVKSRGTKRMSPRPAPTGVSTGGPNAPAICWKFDPWPRVTWKSPPSSRKGSTVQAPMRCPSTRQGMKFPAFCPPSRYARICTSQSKSSSPCQLPGGAARAPSTTKAESESGVAF